ncbi:hypothetical protein TWF569_011932 [Orbilia oligospora]|uniref:Uncharacterized protein n=1 Tax=Orbilia oligospora TaxID=2813651 RepID=A0A7C8K8X2_ORBOL|nr:hypothetical protein TWF102_001166 [Orbilia oligospora]KAF3085610.1 hypothetical protein TWF706_011908 [Orbilia oligospora]KAF3092532.1 hypothetical protein TWF103_011251 [Orbilia oligospora]KAF3126922.1 hypothetical protein TWF569_011932 [Orbilia oligospora]KAF3144874.1 hypothetical protein TWF594_004465 [Orbilia oligospora]
MYRGVQRVSPMSLCMHIPRVRRGRAARSAFPSFFCTSFANRKKNSSNPKSRDDVPDLQNPNPNPELPSSHEIGTRANRVLILTLIKLGLQINFLSSKWLSSEFSTYFKKPHGQRI